MALQTSGTIGLNDIFDEFNIPNGSGLSDCYRNGDYVTGNNTNVPTSGEIAISDFYGAQLGVILGYRITGAGGSGGYGVPNGSLSNSFATPNGGESFIDHSSFTKITASGGASGQNGSSAVGTNRGGDGADSARGTDTGGRGGGRNASGAAGNRGGGGGGGGGDAPSRYDRSGAAGGGGGAGATEDGIVYTIPGATIDIRVGNGPPGISGSGLTTGGAGGDGVVTIWGETIFPTQEFDTDGDTTYATSSTVMNTSQKFWNIGEYVNRTNENDTNNPYSVSERVNSFSGSGRLYIAHKNDYSSSTFYNDTPIACVQVISTNETVAETWWFGSNNQSWQTHDHGNSPFQGPLGSQGTGTNFTPEYAKGLSYFNISTSYDDDRFMLASSTGSSLTGATGGINDPGTTPMPLGQETVAQNASTNYIYRETSGTNPRGSVLSCRSPARTWTPGERIRVAYIIGNRSLGTYDFDDILFVGVA